MSYNVRETAVLTEDLGKRFGATEALRGLDLTVEPGTVLGLLGHNGAGKTTAVRILSTLLAPTSGRALVAGHDVVADPKAVRASISLALPIAGGSVIAGRTVAELVELCGGLLVVALCGLIVGWAPDGSVLETIGAFAVLLFMAFAVVWPALWLGLMVRDPDGADGIVMSVIFPAMFLSGIFVPVAGLPDGLRQIAEFNPLTSLATAMRQLFHSPVGPLPDVFTLQHPVIASLIWACVLMAIFAPLSIRRYQRMGR